ncbi:hypothetical protein G7Y89_g4139 [Cudoniella acicularis]|uniref:Peptidase A1 domain-containing protein n=1 Tax=Cudoniella acicularis TaxID=354080 RepID=A0A8H4W6Z5_9HELO|nr:hypothetical protein G7Y89_g4139 [Cudoniella acicularis]
MNSCELINSQVASALQILNSKFIAKFPDLLKQVSRSTEPMLTFPSSRPRKYTIVWRYNPQEISDSNQTQKRGINSGNNTNNLVAFTKGQQWHAPVTLENQTFNLLVDTWSGSLWVAAKNPVCYNTTAISAPGEFLDESACGFGSLYSDTATVKEIPGAEFTGTHDSGEFLFGRTALEDVTIAGIQVKQQDIGLVDFAYCTTGGGEKKKGDKYPMYTIVIDDYVFAPANNTNFKKCNPHVPPSRRLNTTAGTMVVDSRIPPMIIDSISARGINVLFAPLERRLEDGHTYSIDCNAKPPQFGVQIKRKVFWVDSRDLILAVGPESSFQGAFGSYYSGIFGIDGDGVLRAAFLTNAVPVFEQGEDLNMRFAARKPY